MTEDPLFVSPYLLRPLRSYAEALRDREKSAVTRGKSGNDSMNPGRPGAKDMSALSRKSRSTSETEEDSHE